MTALRSLYPQISLGHRNLVPYGSTYSARRLAILHELIIQPLKLVLRRGWCFYPPSTPSSTAELWEPTSLCTSVFVHAHCHLSSLVSVMLYMLMIQTSNMHQQALLSRWSSHMEGSWTRSDGLRFPVHGWASRSGSFLKSLALSGWALNTASLEPRRPLWTTACKMIAIASNCRQS